MAYVDGFVVPVPRKNVEKYKQIARKMGRIWREHGALSYTESMGDDVKPGKVTSFPQAVKLKKGEVVWLSWAMYKNRAEVRRLRGKDAAADEDLRTALTLRAAMPKNRDADPR